MGDMADEGGGEGEMGDLLDPSMMEGGGGGQVKHILHENILFKWKSSLLDAAVVNFVWCVSLKLEILHLSN